MSSLFCEILNELDNGDFDGPPEMSARCPGHPVTISGMLTFDPSASGFTLFGAAASTKEH